MYCHTNVLHTNVLSHECAVTRMCCHTNVLSHKYAVTQMCNHINVL